MEVLKADMLEEEYNEKVNADVLEKIGCYLEASSYSVEEIRDENVIRNLVGTLADFYAYAVTDWGK